jgi:hypothetical protein
MSARVGTVITSSELRGRGSWDVAAILAENDIYPRDEEHRYRIYARKGRDLKVLAGAGSPEALGVALVTLHQDQLDLGGGKTLGDLGAIGVLDAVAGRWIILPWHRPDPSGPGSRNERNT